MFENIGSKIKTLAEIICWIGIIASVILGIIMLEESFLLGLITIISGALSSWIGSFVLYGFGELIELNTQILHKMGGNVTTTPITPTPPVTPIYNTQPAPKSGYAPNNLKKDVPQNHWPD